MARSPRPRRPPWPTRGSAAGSAANRALMAERDSTSAFALRQLLEELASQLRNGVEKLGDLPQETATGSRASSVS